MILFDHANFPFRHERHTMRIGRSQFDTCLDEVADLYPYQIPMPCDIFVISLFAVTASYNSTTGEYYDIS